MDKARKNDAIHAAADRMAANYKSSQIRRVEIRENDKK